MILDAVRESCGWAVAVDETRIVETMHMAIAAEGILFCPESAACILGIEKLRMDGRIHPEDRIVIFNTGAGTKYVEVTRLDLPILDDPDNVDYTKLTRS
jgi:threonine synthase